MHMTEKPAVFAVEDLHKTFAIGFFRKKVEALRGVSFAVQEGRIFGVLGPNGAGKTTSIKAALGLIRPTRGKVSLFGRAPNDPEAKRRIGYMPENPYVYQYLKPLEFLDLCGRLMGMPAKLRHARALEIAEKVGLSHALDRPIGRFSKGMTQRIGLAQALLHDPELLILDEPMSGLDPIGRKEVRDLLVEQKRAGKTLLFTSHILSDVEMLCDDVVMIHRGKVTARGALSDLLKPEVRRVEIELTDVSPDLESALTALGTLTKHAHGVLVKLEGEARVPEALRLALDHRAVVHAVLPHRETLEDLFIRNAISGAEAPAA
jgi:ABC-2 type transport system ATP-binding protein